MGGGVASRLSDKNASQHAENENSPAATQSNIPPPGGLDSTTPNSIADNKNDASILPSTIPPNDSISEINDDAESERPPTPDPTLIRLSSIYRSALTSISSALPPPPPRQIDFVEVPARGTLAPSLISNLWIHAAYGLLNKHMPDLDAFAIADAKCKQMRSVRQIPQEMLHVVNILDLSTNRLLLYDIQTSEPYHFFESILCLNASMNMLTSLVGIDFCRHLKMLVATDNKICDLSPIVTLAHLVHVDVHSNCIENLPPITARAEHSLLYLSMHHNPLTSLTYIEQFAKLQELDVSYCHLVDLSPLAQLQCLVTLDAVYNRIDDIHVAAKTISSITTLKHLRLLGNPCQVNNPPHIYEIALLLHSHLETLDRRIITENDHKRFDYLAAEIEEEVMMQRLQEEKAKSIAEVSVFYDDLCKRHRKMEEVIEQMVQSNEKHVAERFDDYMLNMKKIHEDLKQQEIFTATRVREEGEHLIEKARSKDTNS